MTPARKSSPLTSRGEKTPKKEGAQAPHNEVKECSHLSTLTGQLGDLVPFQQLGDQSGDIASL